jgi:hypothetical protein
MTADYLNLVPTAGSIFAKSAEVPPNSGPSNFAFRVWFIDSADS